MQCQYYKIPGTVYYRYYTTITIARVLHYQYYCRLQQYYEYSRVASRPNTQARVHVDICASRCNLSLRHRQRFVLVPRTQPSKPRVGPTITRPHPYSTSFLNALRYFFRHLRPPPPPFLRHHRHPHAPTQSKVEGDPDLARNLQKEGERGLRIFGYEPERSLRASRGYQCAAEHDSTCPKPPAAPGRQTAPRRTIVRRKNTEVSAIFVESWILRPAKNTEGSAVFVESWML